MVSLGRGGAGGSVGDEEERREDERRQRDRLFEANKHMSTLSASALALLFAASRFLDAEGLPVLPGVLIFGGSLLLSLVGLHDAALVERMPRWFQLRQADSSELYFLFSYMAFFSGVVLILIVPLLL